MTQITEKTLDEIEAGLGILPSGPWRKQIYASNEFAYITCDARDKKLSIASISIGYESMSFNPSYDFEAEQLAAIAHIARLDPGTVAELVRLARIGMKLEAGHEQYIRGVRVHVSTTTGDF